MQLIKTTIALILALLVSVEGGSPEPHSIVYDVVFYDARVVDGSGGAPYRADVAIKDGRIAAIGSLERQEASSIIDAQNLVLAPGFIDVHSHAGRGLTQDELSGAEALLRQGITTVVINQDGAGAVNLSDQRKDLMKYGLGVNVAQLVPHGVVREVVMGWENRAPTPEELDRMKALVQRGMESGAYGLSSGPFYAPGSYAVTREFVELAKTASEYGGVYTSHIRDESNYSVGLKKAVQEVIQVARQANLPGIVTHIKALGPPVWGSSSEIVQMIDQARSEGVEVYADQYPYRASATDLVSALVPRWAEEGGPEALVQRLQDEKTRARVRADIKANLARRGGAGRIQFRYSLSDPSITGKSLKQVAEQRNEQPLDVVLELIRQGRPGIISFNMHSEDVRRFMKQPWTMTGSDGGLVALGSGVPHPRNYGAFPRKLEQYVFDEQVIGLAFAIRSMTGLPARVFDMRERGMIRPGAKADLILFDPQKLDDNATFDAPHQYAAGVIHVLIDGTFAIKNGRFQDSREGTVLRHKHQN